MIGDSIFVFAGLYKGYREVNPTYPIQRIDLDGEQIINTEIIGYTISDYVKNTVPVIMAVPPDFCV